MKNADTRHHKLGWNTEDTEVATTLRIATQSKERWTRKAADWNPGREGEDLPSDGKTT